MITIQTTKYDDFTIEHYYKIGNFDYKTVKTPTRIQTNYDDKYISILGPGEDSTYDFKIADISFYISKCPENKKISKYMISKQNIIKCTKGERLAYLEIEGKYCILPGGVIYEDEVDYCRCVYDIREIITLLMCLKEKNIRIPKCLLRSMF